MILVAFRKSLQGAASSAPCTFLRSVARTSSVSADSLHPSLHTDVVDTLPNPSKSSSEYVDIREGNAFFSHAKDKAVFYNKVQTFNRDFSILAVRLFAEVRRKELMEQHHDKMIRYNG